MCERSFHWSSAWEKVPLRDSLMTQFPASRVFPTTYNSSPLRTARRLTSAPAACLDPQLYVSPAALSWMGRGLEEETLKTPGPSKQAWSRLGGEEGWGRGRGRCVCTYVVCIFLCFADFVLAAGCRRSSAVRAVEPDIVVRPHTQLVCQEESNLEERTRAWNLQLQIKRFNTVEPKGIFWYFLWVLCVF